MNSTPILTTIRFEVVETLVVSDPCYLTGQAPDIDLSDIEFSVFAPGTWTGHIETQDEGGWGRRVAVLRLKRGVMSLPLERVGEVGVDSGQIYAGCLSDLPLDYGALCERQAAHHYPDCLDFGGGIVSRTGYGDGSYPVYADEDFTVIEVRFLEHDEEER